MCNNITTLGKLAAHTKMQDHMFIDDYFVVLGATSDYYIRLNGIKQVDNELLVAYNNVNGVWYFKFVQAS